MIGLIFGLFVVGYGYLVSPRVREQGDGEKSGDQNDGRPNVDAAKDASTRRLIMLFVCGASHWDCSPSST